MSQLILIKHASPLKDADVPSRDWRLSEEGKSAARRLAEHLRAGGVSIDVLVSSDEPKAQETAAIVGEQLGKTIEVGVDLHEHDRSNVPVMPTREFISSVALFFRERSRRVLGLESADEALARFSRAVEAVTRQHAGKNVAIVTHGTVLALFVAHLGGDDAFQLWRRLGLPSYVVVDWNAKKVLHSTDAV